MKEIVISHLQTVQGILDNRIYLLKEKYDSFTPFNYYWDVMEFIIWIGSHTPVDYQSYDLESCFESLNEFGEVYIATIEPIRLKSIHRNENGVLSIDVPIQNMLTRLYNYVINVQESELTNSRSKAKTDTPSLKDIMDELLAFRSSIGNDLADRVNADSTRLAKEIVIEILSPSPQKKLTKAEQLQVEIEKGVAEQRLKMIRKAAKKR